MMRLELRKISTSSGSGVEVRVEFQRGFQIEFFRQRENIKKREKFDSKKFKKEKEEEEENVENVKR